MTMTMTTINQYRTDVADALVFGVTVAAYVAPAGLWARAVSGLTLALARMVRP